MRSGTERVLAASNQRYGSGKTSTATRLVGWPDDFREVLRKEAHSDAERLATDNFLTATYVRVDLSKLGSIELGGMKKLSQAIALLLWHSLFGSLEGFDPVRDSQVSIAIVARMFHLVC